MTGVSLRLVHRNFKMEEAPHLLYKGILSPVGTINRDLLQSLNGRSTIGVGAFFVLLWGGGGICGVRAARYFYGAFSQNGLAFTPSQSAP